MRIIIVGGGIGGLALAAGLRRQGVEVVVFERDVDPSMTGGYHITLDGHAQSALRELVAPEVFERVLASASALRLRGPDVFWDRRGRLVGRGPERGADPAVDIDRITLRLLLADAAGESLRLGRAVTTVGRTDDGRPEVALDDGSSATGDLLVGADGAHSLVADHLAGGPTSRPAGVVGFSGKTSVGVLGATELSRLGPRSSMALGPRGAALYVGFLDPVGNAVLDAPELRAAVTTSPSYIWGAMFPESSETALLRDLTGPALLDALLARFRRQGWSARAVEVLARAEPDSVAAFRFNAASTSARDLAPWPAGRITALGDAVHATPPTAGMGAGVAIRDAASLVHRLAEVRASRTTLTVAVSEFEAEMRNRGSQMLKRAMKTVRLILATDTRWGAAATEVVLPVLAFAQHFRRN